MIEMIAPLPPWWTLFDQRICDEAWRLGIGYANVDPDQPVYAGLGEADWTRRMKLLCEETSCRRCEYWSGRSGGGLGTCRCPEDFPPFNDEVPKRPRQTPGHQSCECWDPRRAATLTVNRMTS